MSLPLIVTQAGLDAITAADGLGLLPLEITEIAIGEAHWAPTLAATALQNETKRLPVTGGSVVADNYLSIKAIDQTEDVYSVGEVGFYTATGVLMAIYSQPTDISAKATASASLFQVDVEFTSVIPGSLEVGDIGFDNPPATTEAMGVVELADQTEMDAGIADNVVVTPKKLRWGFSALFSTTGYLAFPSWLGGFIIQWGQLVGPTSVTNFNADMTFPLAFPNECFSVAVSVGTQTYNLDQLAQYRQNTATVNVAEPTETGVEMHVVINNYSGDTRVIRYIAIGR